MARRRRAVSEVSLFAFQDVMASLIGVLFFVVLMAALSIVERPAAASGGDAPAAIEAARARARALSTEAEEARQRLAALERARVTGSDPRWTANEVRALHATLMALHERVRQVQRARTQDEVEHDEAEGRLRVTRAEADALDAALAELRDRARAGPRVAYIFDSGPGTPEPWLVELSAEALRVATPDGAGAVFSFGGDSAQTRRERFLAWARRQDPAACYFVLLIKPSAVSWGYELAKTLSEAGFRFGTDLLPEPWQAFE